MLESFSRQCQLVVIQWSLSGSKSPQFSRTLLSILADLKNAVVWMVSILPQISNCSSLLGTVHKGFLGSFPSSQTTTGITVTLMFHSFFLVLWQGPSICLSFQFIFFPPCSPPTQQNLLDGSFLFFRFVFFFVLFFFCLFVFCFNSRPGLLAGIRWSIWVSKSQRISSLSFCGRDTGLCIYHLLVRSNFIFLALFLVVHLSHPVVPHLKVNLL